ncbi:sulfotransferase family protein [Pseudoalteromonas piscicida]|uniref:sulfotransferase family protein n=1 Tax=Pseudoalteromonas piscicida TaxID=43662 RepID=UPI0030A544FF
MTKQKILVTGLPRTGTTSLCITALTLGYKTAHTAYTRQALDEAEFIADTPVFADFEKLYALYPNVKIIHLTRQFDNWLPSIKRLMSAMQANLLSQQGGFNDTIKRCYLETFSDFEQHFDDDSYWHACYQRHLEKVINFSQTNDIPLLSIDIAEPDVACKLAEFLAVERQQIEIPHVNIGGKVTAWKWFAHVNKVESTRQGKADKDAILYERQIQSGV